MFRLRAFVRALKRANFRFAWFILENALYGLLHSRCRQCGKRKGHNSHARCWACQWNNIVRACQEEPAQPEAAQ